MLMQALFVHLLTLTQLYEAGQAVQHFVSLVRESSIEELTRKVRCAFAHFKCCQLFSQTNGDDFFWRDTTINAPQQLTRSVCIVVAGILNDPTPFQATAATHNHNHLKAIAKQKELLPVLAGMAKSTSMTRRSLKSPKNLSPVWKRMFMISAAYLIGMGDATPISMEPTQPEFEFHAQSSQEGFTQAFPIIASNFVKMNPPSESTLIKFELKGAPSWLSIQDEMLVANIDSAVVAGSYLFQSVVVDSISGLSTTLSMQIKVDDNLNDGTISSPILQPRDYRRLAYATSIQPMQAVFKYEIKANELTYIHMPKESGTWIKSTPGDANISITYTLNAVDSSYLTTGSSNRSFHFIKQTTPVVGWRTFTMNAVDNADVANPRSTTLNFQVMSRQMTYNYQDLDPDSLYRGLYAADTDLTRYPWDLDGYEYSGCYASLASTNPWFYIKYPTPVLLDTILIINNEELGSSTISDLLKTVQLRAGDLTGSPANNPLCLSGNGYLSGSGLYSCGKRVARYIGLIQTAPQTGNVILAICEIHVYSYTPNTGSLTVFNTATQASGLPTKSILTLINGERLDTVYQPILAASSLVYFEIRLGVTRFIHQVLLIGHAINAFEYSKRIILTVGSQIGANVVNNPQFYKMPALDNYDKFGKNVIVMDYGSVVAVIRTDGVQLALHYVGIFSTATDCTDAFDWSGSNLEWASQIFIGSPNQVSVQLFASVSDCAVFYILKMLDNSTLPAWISYSEKTLTIAPTSTASLGTYTVRLNAYLNDLTPYRESYYDFTFTVMQTVPLQPQKPVKVSANETSITIRWFALRQDNGSLTGFNGGAAVTKYRIYYDDSGSFALLAERTDLVLLEYPLTSTTPGKTYGFKVSAVNSLGEGPLSLAEYIMAARVPDPPTLLTKVSASGAQITFSWTEPSNGGTSLTGYKIFWNNGSGTTLTLLQQVAVLTTQYSTSPQVTSLIAGASYRFQIQALNAVGDGALSDEIAIYAATVPGNPSAPTMVSQSETQISIQWTALPSGSDGGSPVTDYKVYWDNGEGLGNFYLKQATTTPAMSFTATSLTAGTTYSFKIAAVNLVGESSQSPLLQIIAAILPGPPNTPYLVSADSAAQITIQWTAPVSTGGTAITNYKIYMNDLLSGQTVGTVLTFTQTTGLSLGSAYMFKVSAINAIGEGPTSGSLQVFTGQIPVAPNPPTKIFADALHIEVAWTAPSDGGLPIRGYRVYKNGVHIPGTLETGPTILSLIITDNIVPGANYDISVAAFNDVGESSKSAALTVMAAKIPDAPTGITMISQSSNAIAFRWTAPSDGGTPLLGYKIWWDNGLGGETSSFVEKIGQTGVVTTYTLSTGIIADTVYQIAVKAFNAVGDGPLSTAVQIRAASVPDSPNAPTKLSATTSSIQIQWSAPAYDGGNALTKFRIYKDDGVGGPVVFHVDTADSTALSYTANGLTMGRTYAFKISAWNQVGQSLLSSSVSILCATLPDAPYAPTTSSISSTSITISWIEPSNNGSTIDDYMVLWCLGIDPACTYSTIVATTSGLKTLTIDSLTKEAYYSFKVRAHNVLGFSASSPALIEQAVDRLVKLVESNLVDASYEINPAATRPVELNFPTYSCAVCANSISRSLLVESAPQSPLPSFIVPSDSTGVINIYITNPQDTGTYFFKVVAAEIDGQGNQLLNDQVSFRLMLSCTITRFYNVEKIIGNIQYMIPSNLNSPVRYSELPVYKTEPAYCMLLGVENSLVFEGNSDQQPGFVKIDERTRQLTIYDIDPLTIGTYRFYIRAVEQRSGFEDSTVKFEVNVSCSIEQLEPIYTDKTVFNLNFIIRDKPVTFSLPQYSWKPKTCFKEVKLRLVNESDQTGKYPPFFKANLESMEVSLNGNKEHYIYANREFKLRLIAETLDGAQRNSAYAFVIRTEFKNTPPRFFKDLLPQTFNIGEKAEWHLPLLVDDEGDEITRVAYSPLKPWLKLDVKNLKFQLDATNLEPEDAEVFSLTIYLTDEFGASKAYKQQVELRYQNNMVLDDSALNSSGKLNDTSNFDAAQAQNTTMSENSTLDDNSTSVDNSTTNATDDEVLECDQQAASSNCSSNPQTSNVADQQGAQSDANELGAENGSQDIKSEAAEVLQFDPVQVSVPSVALKNVPKLAVQHSWHQNKLDPKTPIDAQPEVISTLVEASQCNVQLKFSVPMEFLTVTDPRKLFDVTVTPYIDKGSRRLSGVQSEVSKDQIDFSWQTNLSATEINFFVQFNNTYDVSVGGTVHLLKITQKDDFAFKSKANITMQTKVDFVYKLSAQVTASDAGHVDTTTNLSSSGTLSSMLASLVVSTLMYEPLNMLFSMVGSLQYILYLSVLNTNFPGNANLVFKHLMTVMSFDLIPDFVMAPWYERVSKNTNQEDISDKFNQRFGQMGFKTSNWIVNLGSATVFFFWMIALMIILPIFTKTALLDRCRPGRRLKSTLRRTEQSLRWNQMMRFFIEMSFELSLVCAIRVKTYENFSKNEKFFTYSAVSILVALVAFTYLISIFLVDNRPYLIGNRRVLQGENYARKQRLQQQYSTLWEGIDKKNRIGLMNVPFFMISRIAFVMALIFYQELVTFQLMIVTLVAVWQVLFLTVKPYETPSLTYIEFMNQSVAYIVTVFQYALTDHVPNSEWRYKFGWGVVGVVCFFIAANVAIQTHAIIITLKTYVSRLWLRWRQRNSSQAEPQAAVSDPQVPSQPVSRTEGLQIVATANTEPEPRLLRPVQTISRSVKNSRIINLLNIVEEEKDEKYQHEFVLQPQIPSRDYDMEDEVALFKAKPNDIDQLVLELVTNEQRRRRNDSEKKLKRPEQIEEEIIIT